MARVEAGLMLLDVDYVSARKALIERQTSSPFELDLGWTVNLRKDHFVGKEALPAKRNVRPNGSSSASKSTGTRSRACMARWASRRNCRTPHGA